MNEQNNTNQTSYRTEATQYQTKVGLGIASFVLGIIGFLTGIFVIGIFFDIIAIILGIIAIISKKNKKGFAIAGTTLSIVSIILVVFFLNIFDTPNKDEAKKTVTSDAVASSDKDTSLPETEKGELTTDQLDLTEYSYENTIGDTLHFLVIKNNSISNIKVSTNTTALNSSGEVIGADSSSLEILGSGEESCLIEYFDGVVDVDKYEYSLTIKEQTYYESVMPDLSYETSEQSQKVILSCTNNGSEPAQFVEAIGLFFKNGELVFYNSTYITDDDSELKPNVTLSKELDCYEEYDEVKIYLTGRR